MDDSPIGSPKLRDLVRTTVNCFGRIRVVTRVGMSKSLTTICVLCNCATLKLFGGRDVNPSSGDSPIGSSAFYVSELFQHLAKFLDVHFNNLILEEDWKSFYAFLVRILVKSFNEAQVKDSWKINAEDIYIPQSPTEVVSITRLLYQAIVKIRFGVADGQHRLVSLLNVLMGFEVRDTLNKSPPIYFAPPFCTSELKGLSGKCSVRLVYGRASNELGRFADFFEKQAQRYSKTRDVSQSSKRARTLCDM